MLRRITRRKKFMNAVIFVLCMTVAVLIVVGLQVLPALRISETYRMGRFKKMVTAFEESVNSEDIGVNKERVQPLIDDCYTAIKAKDVDSIQDLEVRMSTAQEELSEIKGGVKTLTQMQETYTEKFAKYQITDNCKEDYEALMSDLDTAIADKDVDQISSLRSRCDNMLVILHSDNLREIQKIKNEINGVWTGKATQEQQDKIAEYQNKVDEYLDEQDYIAAYDEAKEWQEFVSNM